MKEVLHTFSGLKMRISEATSAADPSDSQLPTNKLKKTLLGEVWQHLTTAHTQQLHNHSVGCTSDTKLREINADMKFLPCSGWDKLFLQFLLCFNSFASSCSHQFYNTIPKIPDENPENNQ